MNSNSLSHRIESSAMQRMTSEQARDGTYKSSDQTVLFYGFNSVFGTRRRESAGWRQPWREDELIGPHDFCGESLKYGQTHLSAPRRFTNSSRTCWNSISPADRRGFNTKSNPAGIDGREVRRISLILLLTRFRSCAFPSLRGVVRPKRLCANPFGITNTTNERETLFVPFEYTF
jgi:hypothetical protein